MSLTLSICEDYSQNDTYMYGVVKAASFSVQSVTSVFGQNTVRKRSYVCDSVKRFYDSF